MDAFRVVLDMLRENGRPVEDGRIPVSVDWEPAKEWLRLEALQAGIPGPEAVGADIIIAPAWDAEGEPFVAGFRLEIEPENGPAFARELPPAYLASHARQASTRLVEHGKLAEGELFRYRVACLHAQAKPGPNGLRVRDVSPSPKLVDSSLDAFQQDAAVTGPPQEEDMPVFIPGDVLQEVGEQTERVSGLETGGVLIGHLHRDEESGQIFAEVTAQIHARHTIAGVTSLTFTPESWADVTAAVELRKESEIMLGWWHSHPVKSWCGECPPESQARCTLAKGFLSDHDRQLHRTVFVKAHGLALVVNDTAMGRTFSLFGWRRACLEPRGFHIKAQAGVERSRDLAGKQGVIDATNRRASKRELASPAGGDRGECASAGAKDRAGATLPQAVARDRRTTGHISD